MSGTIDWDSDQLVATALEEVVGAFGKVALSDPRTLENRLSDVLPEGVEPRERNLVISASRHGLAELLEETITQGLGTTIAVRYATERLHELEAFELSACEWVAAAFAAALGHPVERS
jgi:hypothetical protein